jgi:Domain of unknown function (DUF4396)
MDAVWPVTALYFGPRDVVGAWPLEAARQPPISRAGPRRARLLRAGVGGDRCQPLRGWVCTLGHIIGAWIVFAAGFTLLGLALAAEYVADFTLAFALGIAFQYFSIAPMRGLGLRDGIIAALQADTLSLTAFEIGLFGWMAVMQLVLFIHPHLSPAHAAYWFLMQIGMVLGFLTPYPVNVWLIRRGIKEAM